FTLLLAFLVLESRVSNPLLDLRLFRSGTFAMACVSGALFSAAVFGSQPYTSLFLQNSLGFSPLQAGIAFLPSTILVALLLPVSGVLGQRLGPRLRLVVISGAALVGLSFVLLLPLSPASGYVDGLLPSLVVRGLG